MNWLRLLRWARWLTGVWTDLWWLLSEVPIQHIRRGWRARRQARRLREDWLELWRRLPPEEQLSYIHPASDVKPPGWTLEKYVARLERERRDKAH